MTITIRCQKIVFKKEMPVLGADRMRRLRAVAREYSLFSPPRLHLGR
jgi:hypothetical protein